VSARGPVAQGIEQQPSKLKVAGSNPAGVANNSKSARSAHSIALTIVAKYVANLLSPMPAASYIRGMKRAQHGSYIFQRPGSENWYVKVRSGGKRIEKSLGTSDRRKAEIIALEKYIPQHKQRLLDARPRLEAIRYLLEPGEHTTDQGERIIATERDLIYLDAGGKLLKTVPNGPAQTLVNPPLGPEFDVSKINKIIKDPPAINADDAIIETYLSDRGIEGYDRNEAIAVWRLYKDLIGKPIKDATRDDGRLLAKHFKEKKNKRATVVKKMGWLRAAVEMAIDDNKLKFNPFKNVVPEGDDEQERLPLNDAEMKACKRNLDDKLTPSDQLLFRLLACTGMRLSEAFEIDGELKEKGVRHVIVGSKTEASRRRVPLPSAALPFLPKKITGHMFGEDTRDNHRAASKRLNRFLNDCGIDEPGKVVHSLRHRMKDRLRICECPIEIQYELLGHEKKTVASGYGAGSPVTILKKWLDKANAA